MKTIFSLSDALVAIASVCLSGVVMLWLLWQHPVTTCVGILLLFGFLFLLISQARCIEGICDREIAGALPAGLKRPTP